MSNEIHRKTDTLFPGNSMTIAELEPLTIQSGASSSNHYATLPENRHSFSRKQHDHSRTRTTDY